MKMLQNLSPCVPALLLGLLCVSCTHTGSNPDSQIGEMPDLSGISGTLEGQPPFICTFEKNRIPPRNPDADRLFQHASKLSEDKALRGDFDVEVEIERLYRIAAAWGHDRAAHNLAVMLMKGSRQDAPDKETLPIDLAEDLVRRNIPHGYTLMSRLHDYGARRSERASLRYLQMAAYLGDPEAQYRMGYELEDYLGDIGKQMKLCSANQGYEKGVEWLLNDLEKNKQYDEMLKYFQAAVSAGKSQVMARAMYEKALELQENEQHAEALKYYQIAVKAGSAQAAERLQEIFFFNPIDNPVISFFISNGVDLSEDEVRLLLSNKKGLFKDKERAIRYGKIFEILAEYGKQAEGNPYRSWTMTVDVDFPTVDEIDRIVPLPPAKLPEWDGKIEWVKKRESKMISYEAPVLPSEKRIKEMALAKGLNPRTGWPVGNDIEIPADVSMIPNTPEEQLPFTCTFEKNRIPKRDPDADKLFQYAEWRMQNLRKELKESTEDLIEEDRSEEKNQEPYFETERFFRIAAAWGHDEAALNLAYMLLDSQRYDIIYRNDLTTKPVEIGRDLIQRGIPSGYYLMGLLRERGHGIKKDLKTSLQYYRKAADLGSPDVQAYLERRYASLLPDETGKEMQHCAISQGSATAMLDMAISLKMSKEYTEMLKYLQMILKTGNGEVANFLQQAFSAPEPDSPYYLGLNKDEGRAARYKAIHEILSSYSIKLDGTDVIDQIDQIVPLPPAKLPEWDGRIEGLKKREKNEPPPLPSERRIKEMALKKGLDPKTGWPLKKGAK